MMSHHHHHHHQAVDNLINVFARASRDLDAVHFKLDKEFQQTYPENVSNLEYFGFNLDLSYHSVYEFNM